MSVGRVVTAVIDGAGTTAETATTTAVAVEVTTVGAGTTAVTATTAGVTAVYGTVAATSLIARSLVEEKPSMAPP